MPQRVRSQPHFCHFVASGRFSGKLPCARSTARTFKTAHRATTPTERRVYRRDLADSVKTTIGLHTLTRLGE